MTAASAPTSSPVGYSVTCIDNLVDADTRFLRFAIPDGGHREGGSACPRYQLQLIPE